MNATARGGFDRIGSPGIEQTPRIAAAEAVKSGLDSGLYSRV